MRGANQPPRQEARRGFSGNDVLVDPEANTEGKHSDRRDARRQSVQAERIVSTLGKAMERAGHQEQDGGRQHETEGNGIEYPLYWREL
jgi:hypothetical protein